MMTRDRGGKAARPPKFNIALGSFIKYGDQFAAKPAGQTLKNWAWAGAGSAVAKCSLAAHYCPKTGGSSFG